MTMTTMEGKAVPQVTFYLDQAGKWVEMSSDLIFKDKNVVLFSLPGAFTPTCTSSHLPRYIELANEFKALGIDEIICVAVNDTYVMSQWQASQNAQQIQFLPDGDALFTKAMGMDIHYDGFGIRSGRYSMLVRNGVIEKMFVEANHADDDFEVSDAETMIKYLNPNWQAKPDVSMITKVGCPYCARAKALLTEKGYAFEEIVLERDVSLVTVRAMSGKTSVPQIFIGGKYIGGSDDLVKYFEQ